LLGSHADDISVHELLRADDPTFGLVKSLHDLAECGQSGVDIPAFDPGNQWLRNGRAVGELFLGKPQLVA